MTVYVDALRDHGWRLGPNCHLIADSVEELHVFAARLGMKRAWFQPTSSPHYDLTARRRALAVAFGAVELGRLEFVRKLRELREARREQNPLAGVRASDWLKELDEEREEKR